MLVEISMLSLALAASSPQCEAGKWRLDVTSPDAHAIAVRGSADPCVLYSESLESALAKDFARVPNVQSLFVERADGNLLVWIAVDNPTREVREKVFQRQFDLIDGFPEISFDFNIIAARQRPPREFASEAKLIYSREG
jgi:hypothetical protein